MSKDPTSFNKTVYLTDILKKKIEDNFKLHIDFICNYSDGDWDFKDLSRKISDTEFLLYPNADWDFCILSNNSLISFDSVLKYKNKFWNWFRVSNTKIIDKNVIDNPTLPFNRQGLSINPITSVYLLNSDTEFFTGAWDMFHISRTKCTNQFLLKNHNKFEFDFDLLSYNENININTIIKLKNKDWCWFAVSQNKATDDSVLNNLDLKWTIENLKQNEKVNKETIIQLIYYRKGYYKRTLKSF
jgi:hypothetical protein